MATENDDTKNNHTRLRSRLCLLTALYSVVSDNFPIARASLILSLSTALDSTALKLKAGGD